MLTMEPMLPDDAALLARLNAMPRPKFIAAMAQHKQRIASFYRELNTANNVIADDDAALLARLNAMPAPTAFAAMAQYRTHTQRMNAWFRELDKNAAPLVWRPLTADRAAKLATRTLKEIKSGMPHGKRPFNKLEWTEKRRVEVQRIAAGRGDTFATQPDIGLNV